MTSITTFSSNNVQTISNASNNPTQVVSPAYNEMTRRLPKNELQDIEKNLESVTKLDTTRFLQALKTQDWQTIGSTHNFPYIALKAFKDGQITSHQFSTVQFYWMNLEQQKSLKVVPIFDRNGNVNEDAKALIVESLKKTNTVSENTLFNLQPEYDLLDEWELNQFFKEMKKLPPSEQNFFVIEELPVEPGHMFRIIDKLGGLPFNFINNHRDYMIPSHGMMQTFLNVKFGKDAVQINPVLGLSSEEDIRNNGLTSKRDLALRFPGTILPTTADGQRAEHFGFTLHDFYHATMASSIPAEHRTVLIQIADHIKKLGTPFAKELSEYLIDMEMPYYRYDNTCRDFNTSRDRLFWEGLIVSLIQIKKKLDTLDMTSMGFSLRKDEFACVQKLTEVVPGSFGGLGSMKSETDEYALELLHSRKHKPTDVKTAQENHPVTVLYNAWTKNHSVLGWLNKITSRFFGAPQKQPVIVYGY